MGTAHHLLIRVWGQAKGGRCPPYFYTGCDYDGVTGLQNNLHRWYNPDLGRWMSQDPISFAGGDANLYGYVANSPTNFTDPFGLEGPSGWGWRKIGSTGGGATWVHRDGRVWKNGKYYTAEEWGSYVPPPPEEEPFVPRAATGLDFNANAEVVIDQVKRDLEQHTEDCAWELGMAVFPWGRLGRLAHRSAEAAASASGISARLAAGAAHDVNGLTKAGRALEKHGSRPGSVFPKATGSVASKNAQGQKLLEEILMSDCQTIRSNRFGGQDIFDNNTFRGVRFDANGNMMGFLEP